jgi:5'-3' exonuclease
MGGAGWKWVQAHLHSTSAVDLLQSGHKTFYIDGGMILHKAFYNNPECALPGNNLSSMLQWIVEKLENLRLTGFDPIIVLDGAMPDSKMETTEQREESRKAQFEKFIESQKAGSAPNKDALVASVDIHGRPRLELIAVLRQLGFNFIQAPYEADSQLVQCWIDNPKSIILTQDSDLYFYHDFTRNKLLTGIRFMYWGREYPGIDFVNPLKWSFFAPHDEPVQSSRLTSFPLLPRCHWRECPVECRRLRE